MEESKQQLHIGLNLIFSTLQLKRCTWHLRHFKRFVIIIWFIHCGTLREEAAPWGDYVMCRGTISWNTQNCWAEPTFGPHLTSSAQQFSARVTVLRLCINYRVHFYLCCSSQMSAVCFRRLRLSAMMWLRVVWYKPKFAVCFLRRQIKWGSKFRWHRDTSTRLYGVTLRTPQFSEFFKL